jgi:hypothetical protein
VVSHRLKRLRQGLKGRADVRATSARWAWVESVLALGGQDEGRAVRDAVHAGGSFAAYQRAFSTLPPRAAPPPAPGVDLRPRKRTRLAIASP